MKTLKEYVDLPHGNNLGRKVVTAVLGDGVYYLAVDKPTVLGKGVNDVYAPCKNDKDQAWLKAWKNLLIRAYYFKYQEKQPTYKGVTLCDSWHRASSFKQWFDAYYVGGYQLDKDVRVPGNTHYSPETCMFVPREVNNFLTDRGRERGELPIGVTLYKNKYRARVSVNGRQKLLGYFTCPHEAHEKWRVAKTTRAIELERKYNYDKGMLTQHFSISTLR